MISMTGYGRAIIRKKEYEIEVEIKSLNSRYLDIKCYLPREILFLEVLLRSYLYKSYNRGNIECRIHLIDRTLPTLSINKEKLLFYGQKIHEVMNFLRTEIVPIEYFLSQFDILEYQNNLLDNLTFIKDCKKVIRQAIRQQQKMARKEGRSIKKHILQSIENIKKCIDEIEGTIPEFKKELFDNMKVRILQLLPQADSISLEQRLMQELAIYLDKYDIHEEINRLNEHIDTMHHYIDTRTTNDIGKTLSFIFQEMQREANTLGSKYSNHFSFKKIITIKEEIEKCRELIQNVM